MDRNEAKQLLPIIQAFADGKTIQVFIEGFTEWKDLKEAYFYLPPDRYRIKPETIKIEHRRFLSAYGICICSSKEEAKSIINNPNFVRWIDSDWITEEVEINHD